MDGIGDGPPVVQLAGPASCLAGLLALWAFLLAGCADSGRSGADGAAPVSRWEVELVTSIGSLDGRDDALSRVGQVLIGPDSTLVVSQPTSRVLLVYDWRGELVRQVGRSGEGPGEFGAIRAIGILGDTLYVSDHALNRVSYFDLKGEFVRSAGWERTRLTFSDEYFFSTTPPQILRHDGTALLQPSMSTTPSRGMGEGLNTAVYRTPYFLMGPDSRIIDTVAWRESTEMSVGVAKNGNDYFYPWPFLRPPRAGMLPDGSGVVVVERSKPDDVGEYRVVKLGPAGDTVFARPFAYEPQPIPEPHLDRQFGRMAERYLEDHPDAPSAAEVRRAFANAGLDTDLAPPVTGLGFGHDGSIWVRQEAAAPESVALWDVLESEGGQLQARVALPEDERVADARSSHVVTIGTGDLDVPTVSLYRIHH